MTNLLSMIDQVFIMLGLSAIANQKFPVMKTGNGIKLTG